MNVRLDAPKRWVRLAAILLVALATVAILSRGSAARIHSRPPIRIAVIADLAPPWTENGERLHHGVDTAIATMNAAGGIDGRMLQAEYSDPGADPAEAVADIRRLMHKPGFDAVYGGTLTSECAALQQLAGWLQFVYVMGSSCSDDHLAPADCRGYAFRLAPSDREVIAPLTDRLVSNPGERWLIVSRDYQIGHDQAEDWRSSLEQAGASTVSEVVSLDATVVPPSVAAEAADPRFAHVVAAGPPLDQAWLAKRLPGAISTTSLDGSADSGDFVAMTNLGQTMIASVFNGRADTPALVAALQTRVSGDAGCLSSH